ncbi:helix-turn-helix domain-containing protein [Haloarculaceae archaeon H-GB1-1]|nr:helix-turn-helix domain-containing protein [Haloarculaceae archaeon H-GB1-1]
MPRARLTLTVPDGVWIGDLSRSHPAVEFRVLAALADDDAGVGLVELSGPDLDAALDAFADFESVTDVEVLQRDDGTALVQFETSEYVLLLPAQGSRVPLEMPFTIREGEATWEVTAPRDRLSTLGEQLDYFGISYTVEFVRQHVAEEPLLTDRQLDLLVTAVDLGYYDTPRRCSLTDVAEAVGIAKSTCSETMHRAESKVITQFVSEADSQR